MERAPVVLDSPDEAELAATAGVEQALVRVTLGVDADTHEAVVTGHHGSKFGLPPAGGAENSSQLRSTGSWTCSGCTCTSARSCPTSRRRPRRSGGSPSSPRTCRDALGWEARVADLGGGFGIRHTLSR